MCFRYVLGWPGEIAIKHVESCESITRCSQNIIIGSKFIKILVAFGPTIWGDTILWCETIIPLICGKDLFFIYLVLNLIWTKKPVILRQRSFLFFFSWSSPVFGSTIHYFYGETFFGLHLYLGRKKVTAWNPALSATILSNATGTDQ